MNAMIARWRARAVAWALVVVLAPVLAENGELYVALGTRRIKERVLKESGFEEVELLETSDNLHRPEGSRYYTLDDFSFGVSNLDMVVTFRNLHNFDADSRARLNSQVFKSLKSGGLYGVVDHTMRHMESPDYENRRRIDPVLVIKEMLDQGFEFVDYSDLPFRFGTLVVLQTGVVGRRGIGIVDKSARSGVAVRVRDAFVDQGILVRPILRSRPKRSRSEIGACCEKRQRCCPSGQRDCVL